MSLKKVQAFMECDACGNEFKVLLDPAEEWKGPLAEQVDEEIRTYFDISIQADMHLCTNCTRKADALGDEDFQPTRDDILKAVGSI